VCSGQGRLASPWSPLIRVWVGIGVRVKGGTARVSQIAVQSEFVDKRLRNLLAGDAHASYIDSDHKTVSRPASASRIVTAALAKETGLGLLTAVLHTVLPFYPQDL
jgi:hypothetical protein